MGSYKLITGSRPERYTPDKPALHGLTALLARHWNELVTTQVPPDDEWECIDAIRDISLAHMTILAEDDKFDKERIRFVLFTEDSLLKFKLGTKSEYLQALLSETAPFISINDSCNHYLVFRKRKIVEEERMQKMEEFIEHQYW
ncbi:MAG: hypothetical protein WC852_07050 [Candidatus Nanoarchaeia archaeon]|jgi:hypothetical protein